MNEWVTVSNNSCVAVVGERQRYSHAIQQIKKYVAVSNVEQFEYEQLSRVEGKKDTIDLVLFLSDTMNEKDQSNQQYFNKVFGTNSALSKDDLKEGAFLINSGSWSNLPCIFFRGGHLCGLIYAVNYFGTDIIQIDNDDCKVPEIDYKTEPALPYRLLWTWDHSTNWYLEQVGIQEIGAQNYYLKPPDGFLKDYKRLIDFMSLNRINGVTVYGFLRDNHGGIDAAKELCVYAKERGVRVMPGVGINAYGGIYWEGEHKYNLSNWLELHPELRAVVRKPKEFHIPDFPELWFPDSKYSDMACPSRSENASYHEEAIAWLAETFEIGGINFETGDYGICDCDTCKSRRETNETWSHSDMALLYPRLFEAAKGKRRDIYLICEAYWDNILSADAIAPLQELPDDAIYQFCINKSYWPRLKNGLTADYVKNLPRTNNILRTHMGSQWNKERYELVAPRFADMMKLSKQTGLYGATIFGEASAFNVVNEINYLAFAGFGYDDTLAWDTFVTNLLSPRLGGTEEARLFLDLLQVGEETETLEKALMDSKEVLNSQSGGSERRWTWLSNRLYRKYSMLRGL